MGPVRGKAAFLAAAAVVGLGLAGAGTALAASSRPAQTAQGGGGEFTIARLASGQSLKHTFTVAGSATPHTEKLAAPDDITLLRHRLYVTFQNGVGPQGQASGDGNRDSTIVEFTLGGRAVRQWDLRGKCDGLTADPRTGLVVATVNEDANSSLYTIAPAGRATRSSTTRTASSRFRTTAAPTRSRSTTASF